MKQERTSKMWRGGRKLDSAHQVENSPLYDGLSSLRRKVKNNIISEKNMRRGERIRLGVSSGDFPPNGHRASPCQAQDRWGSSGDTKICKQTKIRFLRKTLFGNEIFNDEFSFVSTASAGPNTVKHNNPGQ